MNSTTISIKKPRDIHGVLSESELEALRDRTKGYGWLADSARKISAHPNTIRYILKRGYGSSEVINKIRNMLL